MPRRKLLFPSPSPPMGADVRGHKGVLGAPSQLWLCPGSCVDSARSRSRSGLCPQRRTRRACIQPGTKCSPELRSHRHVWSRAEPAVLTSQPPVRVRDCPRLVDVKPLESYKGSLFSCLISPAINPLHSPMLLKEKRGQKMRWWPPRSTAGSQPPSPAGARGPGGFDGQTLLSVDSVGDSNVALRGSGHKYNLFSGKKKKKLWRNFQGYLSLLEMREVVFTSHLQRARHSDRSLTNPLNPYSILSRLALSDPKGGGDGDTEAQKALMTG